MIEKCCGNCYYHSDEILFISPGRTKRLPSVLCLIFDEPVPKSHVCKGWRSEVKECLILR